LAKATQADQFQHRIAKFDDMPAIMELMQLAIEENMKAFLSAAEIAAVKHSMGLDQTLIEDGSYFLIEAESEGKTVLVGCGGWGRRRTLYGGDQSSGRDDSFSDPLTEPARIRAMYTHPDWTRRGIGRLLLQLGEEAARQAGFKSIELGATVAGMPLYENCGYVEFDRDQHVAADGTESLVIKMRKQL
jgi:GNAT superfamily N-acetyltransferase